MTFHSRRIPDDLTPNRPRPRAGRARRHSPRLTVSNPTVWVRLPAGFVQGGPAVCTGRDPEAPAGSDARWPPISVDGPSRWTPTVSCSPLRPARPTASLPNSSAIPVTPSWCRRPIPCWIRQARRRGGAPTASTPTPVGASISRTWRTRPNGFVPWWCIPTTPPARSSTPAAPIVWWRCAATAVALIADEVCRLTAGLVTMDLCRGRRLSLLHPRRALEEHPPATQTRVDRRERPGCRGLHEPGRPRCRYRCLSLRSRPRGSRRRPRSVGRGGPIRLPGIQRALPGEPGNAAEAYPERVLDVCPPGRRRVERHRASAGDRR